MICFIHNPNGSRGTISTRTPTYIPWHSDLTCCLLMGEENFILANGRCSVHAAFSG